MWLFKLLLLLFLIASWLPREGKSHDLFSSVLIMNLENEEPEEEEENEEMAA